MLVKVGDKQFDSEKVPIAFVLSSQEKQIFYNAIQSHLVNRRRRDMAFMLAPNDIPVEIGADWLERVAGKETSEIYSTEGGENE
jgi:hypothetical protein